MAKIELTNKQLRLIQSALELYSRIGILQLDHMLDHPTIDRLISKNNTPDIEMKVGAHTMRGEVVEIGDGYVKTKGSWGNGEEIKTWTDVDKIQLSPDWARYHEAKDSIRRLLTNVNQIVMKDYSFSTNASLGIHHHEAIECREAFDIIQVIRNEFWKENPNRSEMTVDSHVMLTSDEPSVEVKLDDIKDIRKRKLNKLET